jgi:hypothetical protein
MTVQGKLIKRYVSLNADIAGYENLYGDICLIFLVICIKL